MRPPSPSRLRFPEPPLGEAARERPPRAAWMAMFEDAQIKPVPIYEPDPELRFNGEGRGDDG